MKIIETKNYIKLAKSKYPKSETEPYNPWAVCNESTGGKKENPENFEKCVQHIKDQNRSKNKKKKSDVEDKEIIEAKEDTKPAMEGRVYSPEVEDEFVEQDRGKLHRKSPILKKRKTWEDIEEKMRKMKKEPAYAENNKEIKEAEEEDGWPKKLKKGRFTEWCRRNGFDGPSRSCADKAMKSDDASVRGMASFYLNTTLKKKK